MATRGIDASWESQFHAVKVSIFKAHPLQWEASRMGHMQLLYTQSHKQIRPSQNSSTEMKPMQFLFVHHHKELLFIVYITFDRLRNKWTQIKVVSGVETIQNAQFVWGSDSWHVWLKKIKNGPLRVMAGTYKSLHRDTTRRLTGGSASEEKQWSTKSSNSFSFFIAGIILACPVTLELKTGASFKKICNSLTVCVIFRITFWLLPSCFCTETMFLSSTCGRDGLDFNAISSLHGCRRVLSSFVVFRLAEFSCLCAALQWQTLHLN